MFRISDSYYLYERTVGISAAPRVRRKIHSINRLAFACFRYWSALYHSSMNSLKLNVSCGAES